MGRLIDSEELHNALRKQQRWIVKRDSFTNEGYSYDQVHFAIDNAPTVDAVPVVRCKDCKYFGHFDFGRGEEYWCKHFVSSFDDVRRCHRVTEEDFCAWGERRKDGQTDQCGSI